MRDPRRTVGGATVIGTAGAAVVYLLGTLAVFGTVAHDRLVESGAPFSDAVNGMFGGTWGGWAVALAALVSMTGCLNGWTLLSAQTSYAAAKDGLFPAPWPASDAACRRSASASPCSSPPCSPCTTTPPARPACSRRWSWSPPSRRPSRTCSRRPRSSTTSCPGSGTASTAPAWSATWSSPRSPPRSRCGWSCGAGYQAVYQGVLFLFGGVLVYAVMAARKQRTAARATTTGR